MRILFDQGTPVPLRRFLSGHDVATAYERGWSAVTNVDLIRLATDSIVAAIRGVEAGSYQELIIP
jgi:hypothetical protein